MEKRYEEHFYSTRAEWLDDRRIGGSSAATLMNLNPWEQPIDLFNRLTGRAKRKKDTDNEVLKYGRDCEPLIRKQFALDFPQYKVICPPTKGIKMYFRTDKPYMSATVDGELIDKSTNEKGILEIKTHDVTSNDDYASWVTGNIPTNYLIQVLHYLAVMNDCSFAMVVAKLRRFTFEGGARKLSVTETRYYYIDRKEALKTIEAIEKAETDFYENHIKSGVPPQPKITF